MASRITAKSPSCPVWATGKTLEDCRCNLADVLDGWILLRLRRGLAIPRLGDAAIEEPREMAVGG